MTKGIYTWMYPDAESRRFIGLMRSLRKSQGLQVQDVAEKLGIGCCSYRRYESGKARPSLERLIRAAEILMYDLSGSFNYKYYHGQISRVRIRRELKRYAISHDELSMLTGYSKVQIQSTLYNCGEGSMTCLGAIYDVIEREKAVEKIRRDYCQAQRRKS